MGNRRFQILEVEIDNMRKQFKELKKMKKVTKEEMIVISKKLDKLIVMYKKINGK